MKEFTYTIRDEQGIHARPAGLLVKEVQKYESTVTIFKDEKSADARRLMALMGLGIKCGQEIRVEVSGADEDAAADGIKAFLEANL